jgi:hypothetical protein
VSRRDTTAPQRGVDLARSDVHLAAVRHSSRHGAITPRRSATDAAPRCDNTASQCDQHRAPLRQHRVAVRPTPRPAATTPRRSATNTAPRCDSTASQCDQHRAPLREPCFNVRQMRITVRPAVHQPAPDEHHGAPAERRPAATRVHAAMIIAPRCAAKKIFGDPLDIS